MLGNQELRCGHAQFEKPVRHQNDVKRCHRGTGYRSMEPRRCLLDMAILIFHRHLHDKVVAQLRQTGSPKKRTLKAIPGPRSGVISIHPHV